MTELKPCPFCGGKAVLISKKDKLFGVVDFYIECTRCFVKTPYVPCEIEAEEDWNRRVNNG